jgi:uncharacterized damage-inducible protein DinB
MESIEQILKDVNDSTARVTEAVDNTPEEIFNRRQNGKWPVGEHLAHLVILEGLIVKVMNGETADLEDRKPDARVKLIGRIFGDLDRKLQAPEPVAPKQGEKNKEQLRQQFTEARDQITQIIENQDLALLCLGFKHAFFKEMTRYEWVYFTIHHANRHAAQMASLR